MKSVLLAGLTDHETAAIEIMIGMHWTDLRVRSLPRSLGLGVPPQGALDRACGSCVIDLFGFGMRKASSDHAARLLDFLAGRSAVLLLWGNGGGWPEHTPSVPAYQKLVWLRMPYSSADMMSALRETTVRQAPPTLRAVAARSDGVVAPRGAPAHARRATAALAAAPTSSVDAQVPAWRRALALGEQMQRAKLALAPAPRPGQAAEPGGADAGPQGHGAAAPVGTPVAATRRVSAPPQPSDPTPVPVGDRLASVLRAFPSLRGHPLVGLMGKVLIDDSPKLLRVNADTAFVAHVRQGWLLSGLPVNALLRMLHTPHLVSAVQVESLSLQQLEETLRRRLGRHLHRADAALDEVTWELVSDVLKLEPLHAQRDIHFRLHRFPNFTRLRSVDPLDIQLAAICARMPQTVSGLQRAFPLREQSVYRFVVLCLLSGLAGVVPAPESADVSPNDPPPPARANVRKGFFQSFLDRLF